MSCGRLAVTVVRRCGRVHSGGSGMSEMAAMSTRWKVPFAVGTTVSDNVPVENT
jgi:hypothetical protein